ncbi:MAG: pyroglutamyl-peptidase I [Clostridiales bacterium]|nr:pyroglutamyl-peptidase I [Clostridiales bacterium]
MKKILITAFEPFGDNITNPTMAILTSLPANIGSSVIIKKTLPVVYQKCFDLLKPVIKEEKPDFVVCLGLAGKRTSISVERIAVNMMGASIADNMDNSYNGTNISVNGKVGYFTTLPYEDLVKVDDLVSYSFSAGTYICNNIFYRLMEYIDIEKLSTKGGFIHVPFTEDNLEGPHIPIKKQIEIIKKMIKVLGKKNG